MGILPSCNHVRAILWLHRLDFNETHREKASWQLHKDVACCFGQILEVSPYKTVAVQPLVSHLTNHPSNMTKIY